MKKMFLLGDSISMHYGPFLTNFLAGKYEIYSRPGREKALKEIDKAIGGNGGDSTRVLNYIKALEQKGELNYDLFVFNCGLHDIKRKIPEENYQVPVDLYEQNLEDIYQILSERNIETMFINTTPVDEERHCAEIPAGIKRYNADVCMYNDVAERIAKKYHVPVIDLYGLTKNISEPKYHDYAHFNMETRKIQAAFIAGSITGIKFESEIN